MPQVLRQNYNNRNSVIALILTFFLISIDSDSSPDNVSTILNEKESIKELEAVNLALCRTIAFSNLDFNIENIISDNSEYIVASAPFTFS